MKLCIFILYFDLTFKSVAFSCYNFEAICKFKKKSPPKDVKLQSLFPCDMSYLKELITNIFSDPISPSNQNPNSLSLSNQSAAFAGMEGGVENERVAYKLKGYFDLAKEEIDKAVRAEEWGLIDDALLHYQYAQRILREAIATPVPTYITPRYSIRHVLS